MRIIAGEGRGRKLAAPQGQQVRPTADRVKEALFNILQFRLEGRTFLDLFAGSGQIGLEAISRGAKHVVFVDSAKRALDVINLNIKSTLASDRTEVFSGDFDFFLRHTDKLFDIVFIDPPYEENLFLRALQSVVPKTRISGIIVCEHPLGVQLPQNIDGFEMRKSYRYGKVILTTYEHSDFIKEV